jgi:glycerol-3-phosphate acyltransferase PlsY
MYFSNLTFVEISLLLFSYILGSIPFGYIITKRKTGINIMEFGSGNIGSTNVRRIAGKKNARHTQLLDMAKGLIPVSLVLYLHKAGLYSFDAFFIYIVASLVIIGHNFSIFLRFKGGKGINTTLGASILIAPISVFVSVTVYLIIKVKTKYVSLGSIYLGISLPITSLIVNGITTQFYYLIFCSLLIVLKHIPNIKRLLKGEETKS